MCNPITSVITRLQLEATKYVESQVSAKPTEYNLHKSTHPNEHKPQLIDWSKKCPGLISDFSSQGDQINFPVVPSCSQESIVVNDLISCMQGVSGRYVMANPLKKDEPRTFVVHESLDLCWKQFANNILPVAIYYSTLTRFVEEQFHFKYGKVNHALAACLLKIKNDYLGMVAKLEDQNRLGGLNLHRFYCQVQPYLFSFETIKNICEAINKRGAKGGKTLSLLHEFATNCTGKEEKLCQILLEASAIPYMNQLQNWLYHGIIIDPYNEFLVNDNQVVFDKEQLPEEYSDDYWGKCYTINKEKIPIFLEKLAPMILSTGKYLNVLRQCGLNAKSSAEDIVYLYNENKCAEAIQKAYVLASSSLLDHLMQVNDLIGHLKSVKHYLLFDQGDFFMKFMDMSENELNKEIGDILPSRLQTLVELALRTSSASADPYKDNIKTELHQDDIMTLLLKIISNSKGILKPNKTTRGWESLTFIYEVKWPVSLILNKSSIMIYQLIFRYLFFCKYVERLLCKVWIDNKAAKKLSRKVSNEYKSAWDLRQRMLLYVHNLEYYMMVEVIEPNWNLFIEKLHNVKNLDEVLECHNAFQTTCLVKCMLTSPQHFKVIHSFLRKCIEFCLFIESCSEFKTSPAHQIEVFEHDVVDFKKTESFSQKIASFNKALKQHFHYLFKTMVDKSLSKDINNEKIVDMLHRLDFNSYYKKSLDEKRKSSSNSSTATNPEVPA